LARVILLAFLLSCGSSDVRDPLELQLLNIEQCYHESDLFTRRQDGQIAVSFLVTKDGRVEDERADQVNYKDANLTACILGQLRQVKFNPGQTDSSRRELNFNFKRDL